MSRSCCMTIARRYTARQHFQFQTYNVFLQFRELTYNLVCEILLQVPEPAENDRYFWKIGIMREGRLGQLYQLQLAASWATRHEKERWAETVVDFFFFFLCFRQHFESSHLIKLSLKCNNYSRYWFRLIWTLLCHLCRISGRRVRVRCVSLTDVDWAPTQMRIPSGAVVQMMCLIFSGKQEEEADIYSWVYCSWVLVRRNGRLL